MYQLGTEILVQDGQPTQEDTVDKSPEVLGTAGQVPHNTRTVLFADYERLARSNHSNRHGLMSF